MQFISEIGKMHKIKLTLLHLVLINLVNFIESSANSCQWANRAIHCKDVDYKLILQLKERNFTTANIDNCNLDKWENSAQLPFASSLGKLKLCCAIREVAGDCLQPMVHLRHLDLSHNELTTIPLGTFSTNNCIEDLDLSGNKIKLEPSTVEMFNNLKTLKHLDLSLNRIDYIRGVFDTIKNLQVLNVSGNQLTVIIEGAFNFEKLQSLKTLDLSFNYINEIHSSAFSAECPLEQLNLQNNLLLNISPNVFRNVQKLIALNLKNNRIARLQSDIFQHVPNLNVLAIDGNPIEAFPNGIFNLLVNLEELHMSNMKLKSLQGDLFAHNKKLKRLDFSNNKITRIPPTIFQRLTNMVYLNMSHNDIVTFAKGLFEDGTDEHSLTVVDFSYNAVENIEPDIFNMESLTDVHARGNRIKFVDPSVFATCTFPLLYVDLRDNRLVNIDLEFFEWVPNLERFEMTGNPWECKCFDILLAFLNKRRIEYTKTGYFDGVKSTCIALNAFECKVDEKHFDKYYEMYQNSLGLHK